MNKFTNEQLTKMKSLKSIDELKAFLTKENITLTDEEMAKASQYFESGKHELGDDELDLVAGGDSKGDEYKAQAYADGREIPVGKAVLLPKRIIMHHYCSCLVEQVWARNCKATNTALDGQVTWETIYYDCKCYTCGKTMAEHKIFGVHTK